MKWIMHSSKKKVHLSWHGSFVGSKRKKAWKIAPSRIFFTIWKETFFISKKYYIEQEESTPEGQLTIWKATFF